MGQEYRTRSGSNTNNSASDEQTTTSKNDTLAGEMEFDPKLVDAWAGRDTPMLDMAAKTEPKKEDLDPYDAMVARMKDLESMRGFDEASPAEKMGLAQMGVAEGVCKAIAYPFKLLAELAELLPGQAGPVPTYQPESAPAQVEPEEKAPLKPDYPTPPAMTEEEIKDWERRVEESGWDPEVLFEGTEDLLEVEADEGSSSLRA